MRSDRRRFSLSVAHHRDNQRLNFLLTALSVLWSVKTRPLKRNRIHILVVGCGLRTPGLCHEICAAQQTGSRPDKTSYIRVGVREREGEGGVHLRKRMNSHTRNKK
ncbi:hypothetical protein MLD38_033563 [Melastoma candidum]|uniref:Uncharacterized protein n=1 Tax=Melastoma candidum TaxID=119954 RepID=A0ACB9M8H6_9MYRT|nr:hypothetical protein MLD38_033563 [Melastoma candidum]